MLDNDRKKRDDILALALASGDTYRDAAIKAGIHEQTVYRRWRRAEFRKKVADLRASMVSQATGKLVAAMTKAADVMVGLLDSESEKIRLAASEKVQEQARKQTETVDHEERIAALESRNAEGKK